VARRERLQEPPRVADLFEHRAPLRRLREARIDERALVRGDLAVEVGREQLFGRFDRAHSTTPLSTSAVRSMRRPRCSRDRTVPTGTPSDPAMSSYVWSA